MATPMDLRNKVALVTGANNSIGVAICEELLKNGAKVVAVDSDANEISPVALHLIEQYDGRMVYRVGDVTDFLEFEEAFEFAQCRFINIDIVINNAEIMNDHLWELEVDVNLNGAIRGLLLAQKHMAPKKGGVVVNVGSGASIKPQLSRPIYTATKHALLGLTKACGDPVHFKNTSIRVFAYCPGPVEGSEEDNRRRWNNPYDAAKELDNAMEKQTVEHVAKELIPLLKNAPTGSLWHVSGGASAKEIPYSAVEF